MGNPLGKGALASHFHLQNYKCITYKPRNLALISLCSDPSWDPEGGVCCGPKAPGGNGPPEGHKGPPARHFTYEATSQKTYKSDFYTNVQWMGYPEGHCTGCPKGAMGPQ